MLYSWVYCIKIGVLDGELRVIAEDHSTITKLRCLTSNRPLEQVINSVIFFSNFSSHCFQQIYRTSRSLCTSSIQFLTLSKVIWKHRRKNQSHWVWISSGSGSHSCFLRIFFFFSVVLSYPGLISLSML